jgi:hypothetical protein
MTGLRTLNRAAPLSQWCNSASSCTSTKIVEGFLLRRTIRQLQFDLHSTRLRHQYSTRFSGFFVFVVFLVFDDVFVLPFPELSLNFLLLVCTALEVMLLLDSVLSLSIFVYQ